MVTGERLAEQAINGNYIGIPYKKLDCQGLIEQIIKDCGIRKPDGTVYNWRGSNSMYRNFYQWRGTIAECEKIYGIIPQGCLLFTRKNDGGEVAKGYTDGLGNFTHVGLYLGAPHGVIHSTTGGVQWGSYQDKRWSNISLLSFIDYTGKNTDNNIRDLINMIKSNINELERLVL